MEHFSRDISEISAGIDKQFTALASLAHIAYRTHCFFQAGLHST